jgi:hypothetical protein
VKVLTIDALLVCDHRGTVKNVASQSLVTIAGRQVLVDIDPEGRSIGGCPNYGATVKPCTNTLPVKQGYSTFVRVDGHRVCLDTVTGLTDGTPPGTVNYLVQLPGQELVESVA